MINIDICASTYYPSGGLLDIIPHIIADVSQRGLKTRNDLRRGLTREEISCLQKFLIGLTITTNTYRGVKPSHKIANISDKSSEECRVYLEGRGQTSVANYYRDSERALEFPLLPCIVVKKPKKDDMFLPLEICEIVTG